MLILLFSYRWSSRFEILVETMGILTMIPYRLYHCYNHILLPVSVKRSANCSFGEGVCESFVVDFTKALSWILVNKDDKKLDVPHPVFDHTTMRSQ